MPANIAHIREDDDTKVIQTLEDHLEGTAELASAFLSKVGLAETGRLLGLLHDLGKATYVFNQYITGRSDASRGEIDHSTAGAQYLFESHPDVWNPKTVEDSFKQISLQMMELAVASHHSGLIDCVTEDGRNRYWERMMKNGDETHLNEAISRVGTLSMERIKAAEDAAVNELSKIVKEIFKKCNREKSNVSFQWGLLTRLLLSALVDADRTDTMEFQDDCAYRSEKTDWKLLRNRFYDYTSNLPIRNSLDKIRRAISEQCFAASSMPKGLFSLTVPTGGGKTLSSLRFALEHAERYSMDRIIYVIPYTTIIDQNAKVVKSILNRSPGDDYVTECHSNIDVFESDDPSAASFAMDTWDSPIVFTTVVQFLEAFYAGGTKRLRRMHNLANSVIIFDEVQKIPIKCLSLFNEILGFLTVFCGSSAVLCTATQLPFEKYGKHPLPHSAPREIIGDVHSLFFLMKRVEVEKVASPPMSAEGVASVACDLIDRSGSVLIIVNTKTMAKNIHSALQAMIPGDVELYHLSTNMCQMHRSKKLGEMIGILGKKKVICVSTQLIEAGIDIDFETVIRCTAGLDSIAQAAGRCNRNALRETGKVYVVDTDENLGSLPEIERGRDFANQVIRETDDVLEPASIRRYFELYFTNGYEKVDYDYPVSTGKTEFDLLSVNTACWRNYVMASEESGRPVHNIALKQSFSAANSRFSVIDGTDCLVVPYDEDARAAISALQGDGCSIEERRKLLKSLQKYAVNVHALNRMLTEHKAYAIGGETELYCLAEGYYDEDYGIVNEPVMKTMLL